MVASASFVACGLLGGFAYLAHQRKKQLLAYGLVGVGFAFFLEGIRLLNGGEGPFVTFLDILHHVALGGGGAFLVYVGVVEGWKLVKVWKERRHEAEIAFQAKLAAKKNGAAAATTDEVARPTPGKRTGA